MIRVGQGFDVHRHSDDPARALVLGGCRFEGERGLEGHSDADVPAHAAADALLGAAGLGDIGGHFPDTDARWARMSVVSRITANRSASTFRRSASGMLAASRDWNPTMAARM